MIRLSSLISPEYLSLQQQMHQRGDYGKSGDKRIADVLEILESNGSIQTILDYGCGQGKLSRGLKDYAVDEYDPAIPGKNKIPERPYDLVVCTDVMEHIEEQLVQNVLRHIRTLASQRAYFVIALGPAVKELPDGRNAHILQATPSWWKLEIEHAFFQVISMDEHKKEVRFLCR